MSKDITLRTTFSKGAELYQSVRPQYPPELFVTLIKNSKLQPDAKLLEIGPGTGQATEPLAKFGYDITAIELGVNMAEMARRHLVKYRNVKIITDSFETVRLPADYFDLVYAATSFHWVGPTVKFTKPYKILRPNGHLAIIDTNHVSDGNGDKFFFASQPIYKKYKPGGSYDANLRLKNANELLAVKVPEEFFTQVYFGVFNQVLFYSAKEYVQLLNTFSPIISMKQKQRDEFLAAIENLIKEKFSGQVEKHLAMTLTLVKKIFI